WSGLWMSHGQQAANSRPIAPINQKTGGQPNLCMMPPITGAKNTVAAYWAELKIAEAVPRSAVGNHAATMRLLAGRDGDSAAPSRSRSRKSTTTIEAGGSRWTK